MEKTIERRTTVYLSVKKENHDEEFSYYGSAEIQYQKTCDDKGDVYSTFVKLLLSDGDGTETIHMGDISNLLSLRDTINEFEQALSEI